MLPVGDERWRMRLAWRSPRKALPMFAIRSDSDGDRDFEVDAYVKMLGVIVVVTFTILITLDGNSDH